MNKTDTSEIHICIIWQNARKCENEILMDLSKNFDILKTIEIEWTKKNFSRNLTRFYNVALPKRNFKEKECGNGPFLLVILKDRNPKYEQRMTSRGKKEIVNIKLFDAKTKYRKMVDSEHVNSKVHATNSMLESDHDLSLLLGISAYEVESKIKDLPDKITQDLVGADGWKDLSQLFYILNHTVSYVVLRNFDNIPSSYTTKEHGDIDFLANDLMELQRIINGEKVHRQVYRVHYCVTVGRDKVYYDIRSVGDNYYDKRWEESILAGRVLNKKGVYVPDKRNYMYSLAYHALVHKMVMAKDYEKKIGAFFPKRDAFNELANYMKGQEYAFVEPKDLSVYYNSKLVGGKMSNRRKMNKYYNDLKRKTVRLIKRTKE